MKVMPPATRQKEVMISVGGRDGRYDVGGAMYMMMYVRHRASAKPMNMLPHWLWIMVDSMEAWWCELIILPRSRMMSAGMGFMEKLYVRGCCHSSSLACEEVATVLLSRSRILDDSMIMPSWEGTSVCALVAVKDAKDGNSPGHHRRTTLISRRAPGLAPSMHRPRLRGARGKRSCNRTER